METQAKNPLDKEVMKLANGKEISFLLQSWRLLELVSDASESRMRIDEETGEILAVDFDGQFEIGKGAVIRIDHLEREYIFTVNHLIWENNRIYAAETLWNYSSRFILPLLGMSRQEIGYPYLLNTYLYLDSWERNTGSHLYLSYRNVHTEEFSDIEFRMSRHDHLEEVTEYRTGRILFRFGLPDEYRTDAGLITRSRYSRISDSAKMKILNFHGVTETSPLGHILYRHPKMVRRIEKDFGVNLEEGAELYQKIDKKKETYRKAL